MTGTLVKYKCTCMPAEAILTVPFRKPDQDITDWVEATMGEVISRDHRARSPACLRTTMEYAKIHMPENAAEIGGKPRMDS